ncbi:MAG: hypothetical protein HYS08_02010 [Chlamydiae bacterium]|nr:hypothetical protein [Chlamydiota bacterium]MBI3266582.1 hypothetical protein [Chlamydiota bacterium]
MSIDYLNLLLFYERHKHEFYSLIERLEREAQRASSHYASGRRLTTVAFAIGTILARRSGGGDPLLGRWVVPGAYAFLREIIRGKNWVQAAQRVLLADRTEAIDSLKQDLLSSIENPYELSQETRDAFFAMSSPQEIRDILLGNDESQDRTSPMLMIVQDIGYRAYQEFFDRLQIFHLTDPEAEDILRWLRSQNITLNILISKGDGAFEPLRISLEDDWRDDLFRGIHLTSAVDLERQEYRELERANPKMPFETIDPLSRFPMREKAIFDLRVIKNPSEFLICGDLEKELGEKFGTLSSATRRLSYGITFLKKGDKRIMALAVLAIGGGNENNVLQSWVLTDKEENLIELEERKTSTLAGEYVQDQNAYNRLAENHVRFFRKKVKQSYKGWVYGGLYSDDERALETPKVSLDPHYPRREADHALALLPEAAPSVEECEELINRLEIDPAKKAELMGALEERRTVITPRKLLPPLETLDQLRRRDVVAELSM